MNLLALAQAEETGVSPWNNRVLDEWEIPFGDWMDQSVDWIFNNLRGLLNAMAWPFETLIDTLVNDFLASVSWVWVTLGMFLIASLVRNIKVGVSVAGALVICGLLGNSYWLETARTIGFIAVAVLLCVVIGIPVGILCGRFDGIWKVVRPALDAMQVVHSFVYMLPFIFFWGIGEVSATMVTMVFAVPPLIRLTNLGIRQVPADVVEASRAYGAPELRVLRDVQLPLARPAIMTGINQTLLLAISMLGIAAIMGAGGLGRLLFRALSNQDVALAASGGLAFFLVAVILDRMTQGEEGPRGNLFHRIREAWAHRRDPEALLPEADEPEVTVYKQADVFEPISASERAPMAATLVGAAVAVVSVFLTWTADAGLFSAYGRRADEDLTGMSFNGLDASGGSWFGIIVLALAVFAVLAVLNAYFRPGRGGRWLAADGAAIASIGLFVGAAVHLITAPPELAVDPGTGIGIVLAVAGSAVAAAGSILWMRAAPHSPLHPLKAEVSVGRIIGAGIAVLVLTIGAFSGWSFDGRTDTVVSPELQEEIERLRAEAEANPADAGAISAQLSAAMAAAQNRGVLVIDGVDSRGPRLGLIALVVGLAGFGAALLSAGVGGRHEHRQWRWSAVTAGLGAAASVIATAWVFTHVRSADPNYVSGIGAFLTMLGGFLLAASAMPVLKEFRRSKVYEDYAPPEAGVEVAEELAPAHA